MDRFLTALEDIEAAVDGGAPRIRINGPTGVGKSTHVRALCNARRIPLVHLRRATAPTSSAEMIARILLELEPPSTGGDMSPSAEPDATLAAALRSRPLLALDDIEALGEAALAGWLPDLLGRLGRWVGGLQIIIACRLPIPRWDDLVVNVEPFALVTVGDEASEAARFFLHVAKRRGLSDRLGTSADPVASIERVVSALGGLRAAIEHVCTRMRFVRLDLLAQKMPRDLLELVDRPSEVNLWDASKATWDQLNPLQQEQLGRLAVFARAFVPEAILTPGDDGPSREKTALHLLEGLMGASLIWEQSGDRYVLDPNLRACALRQMNSTVRTRLELEHADWVLARAWAHVTPALGAPDDSEESRRRARRWLARAQPDLVAIRDRASRATPPDVRRFQSAVVCLSLQPSFRLSDPDSFEWLKRAITLGERQPDRTTPAVRGELRRLYGRAWRYRRGGLSTALDVLAEGLADGDLAADALLTARIRTARVEVLNLLDRPEEARRACEQALATYERHRVHGWVGISLCQLGRLHADDFDYARAQACWSGALPELKRVGDRANASVIHKHRASVALEGLQHDIAREEARAVVNLGRELGLDRDRVIGEAYLVLCDHLDEVSANELIVAYDRVIDQFVTTGDHRFATYYRYYRALVLLEAGEEAAADAELEAVCTGGGQTCAAMAANVRQALALYRGRPPPPGPSAALPGPLAMLRAFPESGQALFEDDVCSARKKLSRLDECPHAEPRLVARILRRWLERATRWIFSADGRRFRAPGGEWQMIGRKQLARLTRLLVAARLEGPEPLGYAALGDGLWGEGHNLSDETIEQRLRTAVGALRKVLPGLIPRGDDGYRLDPDVAIDVVQSND